MNIPAITVVDRTSTKARLYGEVAGRVAGLFRLSIERGGFLAKDYAQDRNNGMGDCHQITSSAMVDLVRYGLADGWTWCDAEKCEHVPNGQDGHSWLEYRGKVAVDLACGWKRPVIVDNAAAYREVLGARKVSVRNESATRRHLAAEALKEVRGEP